MNVLPDRPYRLKRGWLAKQRTTAALLLAVAVGLGGFVAYWGARGAAAVVEERALWDRGEVAPSNRVEGKSTDHTLLGFVTLFREYELDVTYEDAQGETRSAHLEVEAIGQRIDEVAEPEVRYDPADPSRIALSWTNDLATGRWGFALALVVLGAVMAWGGVVGARTYWSQASAARACAARSEERHVRVRSLEQVRGRYGVKTSKFRLVYELPPSPRHRGGKGTAVLDGPPIVLPDGQHVVALTSPEADRPAFPLADGAPYDWTPEQRAEVEARLSGPAARAG